MNNRNLQWKAIAEHCQAGRCEDAISMLEQLLRSEPANPALHHQLGICHSGACRPHGLVSMPMAISYLRRALSLAGPAASPLRASYLDALGNAYVSDNRSAEALALLHEAAEIYRKFGLLREWAREQYNLGNTYCDMPASQVPDKWQQAVRCYSLALRVRTKDRDPAGYAATMQNLGTAYRELPGDCPGENIRLAIGCYLKALRICKRSNFPAQYGGLHNNLGNAYLLMPGSDDATRRNLHRALTHFEKALRVRNRAARPCDYAATQFNRGQAYLKEARFEPGDLRRAAVCFREARECFLECHNSSMATLAASRLRRVDARLTQLHEAGQPLH